MIKILSLLSTSILLGSVNGTKLSNKEAYNALKTTIASVKKSCGEICDTTIVGKPGKYFDEVTKNVDCPALFSNSDLDRPSVFEEPPMRIPKWLLDDYSYHGKVDMFNDFRDDSEPKESIHFYNFSTWMVNTINDRLEKEIFTGPYGKPEADRINRFLKDHVDVKGKQVLVIGSETPWIEVFALNNGAKHVTTLEYTKILNEIPEITTILPEDFNKMFLEKSLPEFDLVISYSSVEHSGLGRYGDSLNPWGDLIVMARAWCVLKEGGQALIGMPLGPGKDAIYFNSHKTYGPLMLSHLFANFKQIYSEVDYSKYSPDCPFCYQDLFVLEK